MSSFTYSDATREIFALFKSAWDTTGFEAKYPNMGDDVPANTGTPTAPAPWAAARVRHIRSDQAISAPPRLYTRYGTFIVHIYIPTGIRLSSGYELATLVSDAFEGSITPGGVWFRNCRINEVGQDGNYFDLVFMAEFEYDEVK